MSTAMVQLGKEFEMFSATHLINRGQKDSSYRQMATDAAADIVDMLCTTMAALFPSSWSSNFANESMAILAKREMLATLVNWPAIPNLAGVRRVIDEVKAKGGSFPPSIAELLAMLKPRKADVGLPIDDDAWKEAERNAGMTVDSVTWSHEAVRAASREVGHWEIVSATTPYARKRVRDEFIAAYQVECDAVMYGSERRHKRLPCHSIAERREVASKMRDNASDTLAKKDIEKLEAQTGIKARSAQAHIMIMQKMLGMSHGIKRTS